MAIALYKFAAGQVTPERFIKIPPQRIAEGKEVALGIRTTPLERAAYPAGFAVLPGARTKTKWSDGRPRPSVQR